MHVPRHPQAFPYPAPVYPPPAAPHRSVTKSRRQTNHYLHLRLTLWTLGAWSPVWIAMTMWNKFGPRARSVTRHY